MNFQVPIEVTYVALLFGLFVVPRIIQRFGVPAAITSLALGTLAGPGLGLFQDNNTISLLSTLGIVALFLFAGLEANVSELRRETRVIGEHLAVCVVLLGAGASAVAVLLGVEARVAVLVALALFTPSTGFILESLPALGLPPAASFWIRSLAIATEVVALSVLFFTLQSATPTTLLISTTALIAMIAGLPLVFQAFAQRILPYAPKTEFAFLLMVAFACALATKKLGVYYLVGAFVVGMVAQRFRQQLPAMASEKMLHAVEAFASIFVPFYFFHAGLLLQRGDFTLVALGAGLVFLLVGVPIRLAVIALHRRLRLGESVHESLRVSVPMTPTLIFTLVIAQILRERFAAPPYLFGGLTVYALVNTAIPSFMFQTPTPDFEAPELPPLEGA